MKENYRNMGCKRRYRVHEGGYVDVANFCPLWGATWRENRL